MTTNCRSQRGAARPSQSIAAICSFCALASAVLAQPDSDINRAVWKQKYGVLDSQLNDPSWLDQDTDADGVTNRAELAAGTNPFPKSPDDAHFRPPLVLNDPDSLLLEFPTVSGKYYQAETGDLTGTWAASSLPGVSGDGSVRSLVVPKSAGNFFRIRVSDRSTQNDGVSDWAKIALGLSPAMPLSQQTSYTPATLATTLASENVVVLTAVTTTAVQPDDAETAGEPGLIRISRSGSILPGSITVPLVLGGTAVEGTDYAPLPDTIVFAEGVNSIDIRIVPLFNPSRKNTGTVYVGAAGPAAPGAEGGYQLGTPSSAGVTVAPSGAPTGTGLTAAYYPGASSTYTNLLNFGGQTISYVYTRATTTSGSAIITYTGTPATPVTAGSQVRLQFTSGGLNAAPFNAPTTYTAVEPVTANSFKINISNGTTTLPSGSATSYAGIFGNFHAPVMGHDPVIDNFYYFGSPNGVNTIGADNYSARWETYLAPASTGNYNFQLDADDKARVILYQPGATEGTVILENGWDTPATGGFKQSDNIPMTAPASPAGRYRIVVEFVETTGAAKCKLQWRLGTAAFANIPTANTFRDNTGTATGNNWTAAYFNNTTFSGTPATTQFESAITANNNGDWGIGTPHPSIHHNNFTIRWTGQVVPQYSGDYWFSTRSDDGVRLLVNDQQVLMRWPGGSAADTTQATPIQLKAGVFYDIVLEYYEGTGSAEAHLSWYSADQAKQIIPTGRLFPSITNGVAPRDGEPDPPSPPVLTSSTNLSTVINPGTPFSTTLVSSNSGIITAIGLPDWLTLENGVLSGTPPGPGVYQFTVITTNEAGSSSAIVTLEVLAGQGTLTRETWAASGPKLSDVPWHTTPAPATTVSAAQDTTTDLAANTGVRLRGYFIAPSTGNYYFWLAASNNAQLWISNDAEPVNKILRASVAAPGTAVRTWNSQPSQKSPWLSLVGGRKYYIEVLHNTGANPASNHVSVGSFLDPTGNTPDPIANNNGLLPAHLLSPWDNPPTTTIPGTLYVTNLSSADGLTGITATGGAFVRAAGSSGIVQLNYAGLSSGVTSRKIVDAAGATLLDIGAQEKNYPALRTTDGGFTWNLSGAALTALNAGEARVVIGTVNHPSGEINGTLGRVEGSQAAPAPPAYPSWPADHTTNDAANSRFLTQATFGPSPADMASIKTTGYRAWIDNQFGLAPSRTVPDVLANLSNDPQNPYGRDLFFNSWWKNSITAPDQLRQRAAFALSEIFVVSNTGPLDNNGRALADYYDSLLDNAFGNFRDILKHVTLSPAMGVYLDMRGNAAGNIANGVHPNENYAREILQLFSAGLYRRWPDGSLVLDSKGLAVPTYDQSTITGFARVYTGWNWGQPLAAGGRLPTATSPSTNYLDPMILIPSRHELGTKILMDNVVLPAATAGSASTETDPSSTYTVQSTDPALGQGNLVTTTIINQFDLNGLRDLEASFDNIMNNPAVGPYICRQLIQRLVTSHPKPGYVSRVVRAYNGERNVDGVATGVVGDMKEVFRAILLDYEARHPDAAADPKFGKQREPVLRLTGPARSFNAPSFTGATYRQIGLQQILVKTPVPHRLGSERVHLSQFLSSDDPATPLPHTGGYDATNMTPSYAYVHSTGVVTINSPGYLTGDTVTLQFTSGNLNKAPFNTPQNYTVTGATPTSFTITIPPATTGLTANTSGNTLTPYNFTVNTTAFISPTYAISGRTVTFTLSNSGIISGQPVQVKFTSGSLHNAALDKTYTVATANSSTFTITLAADPPGTTGGSAIIPRFSGGYNVIDDNSGGPGSFIDFYTNASHNLVVGSEIYINILLNNSGGLAVPDGTYEVAVVRGPNLIRVVSPTRYRTGNQGTGGMLAYPLSTANWTRSGTCTVRLGTFSVGGTGGDLGQTPLNSPTVFNYFYPDYQYPGAMAQAGMTTPEFQLSDDSAIMNLTNGISTAILSGTTNGFTNYKSSSIVCDLGPYMTPALTSNEGISGLIEQLGTLLTGGNLSGQGRTIIENYVTGSTTVGTTTTTHFPYTYTGTPSTPAPTTQQMRDRVRAVVHLIVTSPEYAIQR